MESDPSGSASHLINESGVDIPVSEESLVRIVAAVETHEKVSVTLAEVVFVDEAKIVEVNQQYLGKNYVTDIITFPYDNTESAIEGTLFCCAQRIFEQAGEFQTKPEAEFIRVVVHGLLHLCGYNDKTEGQRQQMRAKEEFYLNEISTA